MVSRPKGRRTPKASAGVTAEGDVSLTEWGATTVLVSAARPRGGGAPKH
jgi:hypothetical protein